ncbi:Peptidase M23 [Sphingomonas sp. EC-HK361]|uniref:M23 family metallopeptidase n=1 Tax=Sphingomonas sp. EC-HK361 TaxID=2038397 RepID=UPI001256D6C0|nr:M23 family metallopeptidase [Sphingomonas sp. EC-HK361]VVT04265.1 Peptidase M23 [Sphingomonas sp. EC-HK361]
MTKLGWSILAIILIGLAAFGSMLSFGSGEHRASAVARVQAKLEQSAPDNAGVLVVPVAGVQRAALIDSWGDARGGGTRAHHGIDIMAPGGTPVVAAAAGAVEKLFHSNLGGTTIYVRSPRRGWIYYYAHLSGYAPGLHEGQVVRAGQTIGYVGDTGDAGPGNTHLHFSMTRTGAADGWWQGQDVNPFPVLAGKAAGR